MQKLAQIFIQAKESGKKKSQQKRRAVGQLMWVWLLFVTPFVIPAIIDINQKLKETSWQEIKSNQLKLEGDLLWSTQSGFIFLVAARSLVFGLLFWLILVSIYHNWRQCLA